MHPGKSTKPRPPSRPFNAAEHLRSEADVAAYIEAMIEDGDPRAVSLALRTVADFLERTTQYRRRPRED
jgi:DNA-binding phage protein